MVEKFAKDEHIRPEDSSIEWNLKGSGDNIEDWEFTNEAIKSLLAEHYSNKGNPFTQVKIDSRDQLGDYLLKKDFTIVHTPGGHIFQKGIENHFGDFPLTDRAIAKSLNATNHHLISRSELLQHSSAEGVFLGAALFMEEAIIREFLGIPKDVETALLPSHRRKFNSIQVEIDSMLIWFIDGHTYIAIFEVKSDSRVKPRWGGGYSYHQVKNTAKTVGARFDKRLAENTTIIPVYFRAEWNKSRSRWTARLDRFKEIKEGDLFLEIDSSLDIYDLPR